MDCCGGQNHQSNAENHKEKKMPWASIVIILLIVGLLVFSVLK